MVLGRTVEAGGDANDLNLLGIASYNAGDLMGALDAFKRAKDAGSGAAAINLSMICDDLGLPELSKQLKKEASEGVGGRTLGAGRVKATSMGGKR